MKATIKEIASLADVSPGTVSRALNDRGRVNAKTRERIMAIARKLDYSPNAFARGLVLKRTETIMLLVPDISNPYFAEITKIISNFSRRKGYNIFLCDTNEDPEIENAYLKMIKRGVVDGALITTFNSEGLDIYFDLAKSKFPLIFIDSYIKSLRMNHIIVDNLTGGEMVIDYLYEKGHRQIAYIASDIRMQPVYQRYQGFLKGHKKYGLPVDERYVILNQPSLEKGGTEGVKRLLNLDNPPTAIFAANDLIAIGCISSILHHNLRVPEDIAVVGYDDIDISAYLEIPLTTVAQPKEEMGRKAVDLIVDLIEKTNNEPVIERVLKPSLVVRDSA